MLANDDSKGAAVLSAKYRIVRSEKLGRYLIAARDIAAGEAILREEPVAVGPASFHNDHLCFACMRPIRAVKVLHVCSKCHVAPLCDPVCERRTDHHTAEECNFFEKHRNNAPASDTLKIASVLLHLRLWLLKGRDQQIWSKVIGMEAHVEERRGTSVWNDRETDAIDVVKKLGLMPADSPEDVEFLQRLCGILDVNSFELRSPDGLGEPFLRGIYTEASMMAHDCRGNTHLTVDDKFLLTVYASVPIKEGDTIFFNYTSSLLGSAERREHLRVGKYFECECAMCKDPFELESNLSSIICPRCKTGFVGMVKPLEGNPYGRNTMWQCKKCGRLFCGWLIKTTLKIARSLIEDNESTDVKELEVLLAKLSRTFHGNHFLVLDLKQKLLAGYRKELASVYPKKKVFQRIYDLCKELSDVLDIVEPGISRLKGIMLYEMHLSLAMVGNRDYSAREISAMELESRLEKARRLLKRALSMLLLEPATTPEGRLAKRALQELKALTQNIMDVKSLSSGEPKRRAKEPLENGRAIL